jgi:hypothetical protein
MLLGFCAAGICGQEAPKYRVDPLWPQELPNNWIIGQIGGMAVDGENHIWVLQRPASNTVDELGAAQTPPRSECCFAAPPVLEFDREGHLLRCRRRAPATHFFTDHSSCRISARLCDHRQREV